MSFKTMDDGQVLLYAVSGKPMLSFPYSCHFQLMFICYFVQYKSGLPLVE